MLFSAPPKGDASLEGNVFGFVAMLLLVAYVVSTRHFRRDMDVATFMATICPIAAVAVLPIAIANGDGLGMSGTGWTYMLILTFLSGVAANGLMVYAQKTIQIGTIAIAQVVQPAIAVVWSFLLLGETLRLGQVVGIAIAIGGLAGVPGAEPARRAGPPSEELADVPVASEGAVRSGGDLTAQAICLTACASVRSRSVMKWDAASMRRSASRQSSRAAGDVAGFGGDAGQCVEREDLDVRLVGAPGVVEDRDEALLGAGVRRRRCPWRPGGTRRARPARRRRRRGATRRPPRGPSAARSSCPSARRTRPRWTRASAARRTSPVASAFSIASSRVAAPAGVVAGLALRAAEAGELVRLGLLEPEAPGRLRGAAQVDDGVVEAVLDAGELAAAPPRRERGATGRRRSRSQCST